MIERINNLNVMIIGLKKPRIENVNSFLKIVKSKFPNVEIFLVNADYCISLSHAKLLAIQYYEAKRRGLNYAKKVDLILRFALDLQIDKAIKKAGYKRGKDSIVIVFGNEEEINELKDILSNYGKIDEGIIKANSKRIKELMSIHKINSLTLNSVITENTLDELASILCERAATLGLKKY
jgi:tRNA threonylcarbamoyladenosine modification (KEOPS) complex Cgi121 subunit